MTATARLTDSLSIPRTPSARIREAISRHPFAAYVAFAWTTSWAYWLWMVGQGAVVRPGGTVSHFPGLFGPMLAAFIVTAIVGGGAGVGDLLRRMFRWRVAARWYALAALPFGLFVAGSALLAITGGDVPTIDELATYSGLPLVGLPVVVVAAFIGNGFGEEVGWRGFAQPTLERRMGFLRAAIVVGIVWAIWHVPSFPVIETYREMGLSIVPIFVFGLGSGAIVLGWLYTRSGGSILMAALFHLGLNMGTATLAGRGLPGAFVTTGIMVWAALIVMTELRRSRTRRTSARRTARSVSASIRDAGLRVLLASPLRGMVGSGVLLVTYRGRRTSRIYTTPVEYAKAGEALLVFVANPERKQWWRNVIQTPEVELLVGGRVRRANAVVEIGQSAQADADAYVAARPRARAFVAGAGAELVMVRFEAV